LTWIHAERTDSANVNGSMWSSEGESGEVESKEGLDKHHGTRGGSKRSRRGEKCGKTTLENEGRKLRFFILWVPQWRFQKGNVRCNEAYGAFQETFGAPLVCLSVILMTDKLPYRSLPEIGDR
jgi:hypothetical protein